MIKPWTNTEILTRIGIYVVSMATTHFSFLYLQRHIHLFITDDKTNVKPLREQDQREIPNGTVVCPMAIDVDHLDSKAPATP